MSVFAWDDDYSLGIQSIDLQHRKIIELIDELVEAIRDSREDCIINEVLEDLTRYADYHFTLEDRIMRAYGYPDLHDHETGHREFVERVRSLRVGENVRARDVPRETLDYLENWFRAHELKEDAAYARDLREKGLLDEIERRIERGEL